jgi:hypothetical protein
MTMHQHHMVVLQAGSFSVLQFQIMYNLQLSELFSYVGSNGIMMTVNQHLILSNDDRLNDDSGNI